MAAAAMSGVVVAHPLPASAGASVPYHFSDSGSVTEPDLCGLEVTIAWSEAGTIFVRPVKDSEGEAYFAHSNFELTEVISTAAGSVRVVVRSVFHEQHASHVVGDVWQFAWIDAGTFRLYAGDGSTLLRGSGVFKATQQFDTLGDGAPGGRPVPGSFTVLHERGQLVDDEAFCEAVLPELT